MQSSGGMYTHGYEGSVKDKLFAQYVDHIKAMMEKAETNQNKLLAIIDMLFSFTVNPQTMHKEITINASLNDSLLQTAVEKTRAIILDLYLNCEKDFVTGLEIFEAIVEKQIMETSAEQVKNLRTQSERTLAEAAKISERPAAPAPAKRVGFAEPVEEAPEPAAQEPAPPPEPVEEAPEPAAPEPVAELPPGDAEVRDEGDKEVLTIDPNRPGLVIDVEQRQKQQQLRAR